MKTKKFSELAVGQFYMYPLERKFQQEFFGIWMKTVHSRFDCYGGSWNIVAVCLYGENLGKFIDHERDTTWDNAEVILL